MAVTYLKSPKTLKPPSARQSTITGSLHRKTKYQRGSVRWCELTDSVVCLLAKEMLLFNLVEKPAFKKMLQSCLIHYRQWRQHCCCNKESWLAMVELLWPQPPSCCIPWSGQWQRMDSVAIGKSLVRVFKLSLGCITKKSTGWCKADQVPPRRCTWCILWSLDVVAWQSKDIPCWPTWFKNTCAFVHQAPTYRECLAQLVTLLHLRDPALSHTESTCWYFLLVICQTKVAMYLLTCWVINFFLHFFVYKGPNWRFDLSLFPVWAWVIAITFKGNFVTET